MKLKWDSIGERFFEAGIDRCVLYQNAEGSFSNGVAWNGLLDVELKANSGDSFDGRLYRADRLYDIAQGIPEYSGKLSCYTYPDEFEECIGYEEIMPGMYASQQTRPIFGLSFRTMIGNDAEGIDLGYKIHLVYNCLAETNDKTRSTIRDNVTPLEMMYEFETFSVDNTLTNRPTSEVILDSRKLTTGQLELIESVLYGSDEEEPRMPFPEELVTLLSSVSPDDILYPYDDLYPDDDLYMR